MNGERGFSLTGLIISIAVMGLIVSFLGTAVYQILTVTERSREKMQALHDLQNASCWVSVDAQGALSAAGDSELVLTMPGGSTITYTLAGRELRRTLAGSQIAVARDISNVSFSVQDRYVSMELTSSPQGRLNVSESKTYRVYLRPGQ